MVEVIISPSAIVRHFEKLPSVFVLEGESCCPVFYHKAIQ